MKTVLIVLLVVAMGCSVSLTPDKLAQADKERLLAETVERIRQLEIAKQEQQLMKDIMQLRYEQAVLNAKMKPPAPPEQVKE
jgi:hypothetical protein